MGRNPLPLECRFEYNVIPNLNIHANLEFGGVATPGAWGGVAAVAGHVGFQFGISYLF